MLIKVCGITSPEDAKMLVSLGVDMMGLVFHKKSPRFVTEKRAIEIIEAVKGSIKIVGVFKRKGEFKNAGSAWELLDFVQVYEPVEDLDGRLILGFPAASRPEKEPAFYILDKSHGKGRREIYPKDLYGLDPAKVILSGGITPFNVDWFLENYKAAGVDVSSGVELRPGVKSYYLVEEFVRRVRKR